MKLNDYPKTDLLYTDLASCGSVDSRELSNDFIVDYDGQGRVVGLDIQHASKHLDLSRIETLALPLPVSRAA